MFVYCADTWCDSCGERLRREIAEQGLAPADWDDLYVDSDSWPQPALEEPTDGPDHCANGEHCLEAVDLLAYGLPTVAFKPVLVGAETQRIGAPTNDGLTEYGVAYLKEMLDEPSPTAYQTALFAYWRELYRDEL